MMARLQALLAADPGFRPGALPQGLSVHDGLSGRRHRGRTRRAGQARRCPGTARETAHTAALAHWIDGDPEAAIAVWDQILEDHPHDILAFRLAHFVNFWAGRPEAMLASVLSVERHWSPALPGYGSILACRCFAHEEAGYYLEAEHAGREAVRRDPTDLWAAHGVAHVLEMTGRRLEGIAWVEGLQSGWDGTNNLKHHLWWHQAMYHLELGDFDRVLALYDAGFRDLASPLTTMVPDLYIDVQNAASMLFRLGRHGVDVGDRWTEIADKAEARIGDCQSAFTLPHWMMALAATGRDTAAPGDAGRHARFRRRSAADRTVGRGNRLAGDRGCAGERPGPSRRGAGADAPGDRGNVPHGRQPCPAGRAGAGVHGLGGEGGIGAG